MLAMDGNDHTCVLETRGVLQSIASMLAPTRVQRRAAMASTDSRINAGPL